MRDIVLTPPQMEQFKNALKYAFKYNELKQVMLFGLGERLDDLVAANANYDTQVMQLVEWANEKNQVAALLARARLDNPGNVYLRQFESDLSAVQPGGPQPAPPPEYQPTLDLPQGEEDVLKSNEAMLFGNQDARLPFSFLQGAVRTARSIVRLAVPRHFNGQPDGEPMFGTGWIIAPGLIITNHHVIDARDRRPKPSGRGEQPAAPADFRLQAERAVATFDYYTGNEPSDDLPELRGGKLLAADETLDYAVLEFADTQAAADRDPLKIMQRAPVLSRGARMNILQHPQGRWMRFAIRNNFFVRYGENPVFLRYQTDTEPGASGSPVCSDEWRVVGLHHASVKVPSQFVAQEMIEGLPKPVAMLNEAVTLAAILDHMPADLRKRIADAQTKLA